MSESSKYKSLEKALDALKSLPPDQQKKLIENLLKKDPNLAALLKDRLFDFSDIAQLAKADFKFLWFEIPRQIWLYSLRGATNELLIFVRSCLTERAFKQLLEDLKDLGPQPVSRVQEAQKQLLDEINALAKQGRVYLPRK